MRESLSWFMLIVTIAVGFFFLITVPTGGEKVRILETQVAALQATNNLLEGRITPSPTASPTVDPTLNAAVNDNLVATAFTATPTLEPVQLPPVTTGARVETVQVSTSVDSAGCAISPAVAFAPFDTIYGVAVLADMEVGTTLSVQFTYGEQVIYEETFTIQMAGSFCRWYTIEPDAAGWETGSYRVSYTVNDNPPITTVYTINS